MGLYLADGSGVNGGTSITITKIDPDIVTFLTNKGFKSSDGLHHHFCGTELCNFLKWFGLNGTAKYKKIPEKLFECSRSQIISFLQGYFDGDGTAGLRNAGYVKVCSASSDLIKDLQVLLLNFGIISRRSSYLVSPTRRVKVESLIYNLELEGHSAYLFHEKIGFRTSVKNVKKHLICRRVKEGYGDVVPINVDRLKGYSLPKNLITNPERMNYRTIKMLNDRIPHDYLQEILDQNYFYDTIKSIAEDEDEVFDFVIPETHSFFSNGYTSHNTPRGSNHAKDLYDMAKHNTKWFCQRLTNKETNTYTQEQVDEMRKEGMTEDMIQQEVFCSFTLGIDGSYYANYLTELWDNKQIGIVPWDRTQKVHTSWDIGIGDSCVILFWQCCGKEIHFIDYFENQGKGMPYYADVLKDKPYIYGSHFAPHDIKAREFGSGNARVTVAADLGVDFTVLDTLKWEIEDGIENVRGMFPRFWIDHDKCCHVVKSLENYRKGYDSVRCIYKNRPLHDRYSHCADSIRYACIAIKDHLQYPKGPSDRDIEALINRHLPRFN